MWKVFWVALMIDILEYTYTCRVYLRHVTGINTFKRMFVIEHEKLNKHFCRKLYFIVDIGPSLAVLIYRLWRKKISSQITMLLQLSIYTNVFGKTLVYKLLVWLWDQRVERSSWQLVFFRNYGDYCVW